MATTPTNQSIPTPTEPVDVKVQYHAAKKRKRDEQAPPTGQPPGCPLRQVSSEILAEIFEIDNLLETPSGILSASINPE